jgi:DNA invertase Pin-like site-specific DNA recombinase
VGRSLRDLIAILGDLKERGVKFRSLTEQVAYFFCEFALSRPAS